MGLCPNGFSELNAVLLGHFTVGPDRCDIVARLPKVRAAAAIDPKRAFYRLELSPPKGIPTAQGESYLPIKADALLKGRLETLRIPENG